MDIRNWCNSGCKTVCLDRVAYHEIEAVDSTVQATTTTTTTDCSNKLKWKLLWMKLKKERRKIFDSSDPLRPHVPYNPYTYSQNFDQGFAWEDPDNLSRSFSMRFADPSTVFIRKAAA